MYLLSLNMSPVPEIFVEDDYELAGLVKKDPDSHLSYQEIQPTHSQLIEYGLNAIADEDPNTINEKVGLPPAYVVFKYSKEGLIDDMREWIKSNFSDCEIKKETASDIYFVGEFNANNCLAKTAPSAV